jgi:hypothetical protein
MWKNFGNWIIVKNWKKVGWKKSACHEWIAKGNSGEVPEERDREKAWNVDITQVVMTRMVC